MHPETPADTSVRLEHLVRRYREGGRQHAVLNDLSLAVRRGESVALRGRSGSGKSTLLNLVSGIDAPDSGRVWLEGQDLTGMNEQERTLYRRRNIGFVYQSFNLIPTLTVADNVALVLELNGIDRTTTGARVAELLEAVELAARADSYPETLSGGEQQRVAIARALVHRPVLLLADEPTGNLDDDAAANVLQLINRLRREQNTTLIMATHSAGIAAGCERVVELRGGRIAGPRG